MKTNIVLKAQSTKHPPLIRRRNLQFRSWMLFPLPPPIRTSSTQNRSLRWYMPSDRKQSMLYMFSKPLMKIKGDLKCQNQMHTRHWEICLIMEMHFEVKTTSFYRKTLKFAQVLHGFVDRRFLSIFTVSLYVGIHFENMGKILQTQRDL